MKKIIFDCDMNYTEEIRQKIKKELEDEINSNKTVLLLPKGVNLIGDIEIQ